MRHLSSAILLLLSLVSTATAQTAPREPGWVVIPLDQYRALRERTLPVDREIAPSPVEATLTRVDYDFSVASDVAAGRARLTVDVLKEGWVRVPIPAGLMVREARLDGKPVFFVPAGKGGALSVALSKRGRSVLLLDVALPVTTAAGEQRLSLPASASGITQASLSLARTDLDLRVTGGYLAEKPAAGADTPWVAYAAGQEPLTFTWRRKMEQPRTELPLRWRGSLTELLGLGEDSTSISAEIGVEVVQGAARQVKIQLPGTIEVNQVSGATVADWEVKAGQLTVAFLEPVEQAARFVIAAETKSPREGEIEVPVFRLLEAERESGGVAVEVLGAGEIKTVKPQGLDKADAGELGPMVATRQSPSLEAFRFRAGASNGPRSLTVNVARYTQQAMLTANIEESRYRVLIVADGKMLVVV